MGSTVKSREAPLNQRRVSGSDRLAVHSRELTQEADGAKIEAVDCGAGLRIRRWPVML
jgi:hypothetical protein